jgi:hypothetical protein
MLFFFIFIFILFGFFFYPLDSWWIYFSRLFFLFDFMMNCLFFLKCFSVSFVWYKLLVILCSTFIENIDIFGPLIHILLLLRELNIYPWRWEVNCSMLTMIERRSMLILLLLFVMRELNRNILIFDIFDVLIELYFSIGKVIFYHFTVFAKTDLRSSSERRNEKIFLDWRHNYIFL